MAGRVMCVCALILALLRAVPATAQDVWFVPLDPPSGPKDYMALFQPDAPWQRAMDQVRVFSIPEHLALYGPEAALRQIFGFLHRRHMRLEVGFAPLSAHGPDACGYHVESYGAAAEPLAMARRLASLGADPYVFAMDEPLYYGHVFDRRAGTVGCHSSIDAIVADIAAKLRQIQTVYPNARLGDVEPITFDPRKPWYRDDAWLIDLAHWFHAYQAATGQKLAFFRLDLWWDMSWARRLPPLIRLLAREGIPLQVIYNGNGHETTDRAWVTDALAHARAFEQRVAVPQAAAIQFWGSHPSRMLPETDPNTATGLIERYVAWRDVRVHTAH